MIYLRYSTGEKEQDLMWLIILIHHSTSWKIIIKIIHQAEETARSKDLVTMILLLEEEENRPTLIWLVQKECWGWESEISGVGVDHLEPWLLLRLYWVV